MPIPGLDVAGTADTAADELLHQVLQNIKDEPNKKDLDMTNTFHSLVQERDLDSHNLTYDDQVTIALNHNVIFSP